MLQQRTLKSLTKAVGVGLHSGQRVELTLRPAQPDTGIVFRRVDLPQPVDIPISALAVTDTRLASTISTGGAKVHTVEHLMSACAGLGIDNLYVDITAEEVPLGNQVLVGAEGVVGQGFPVGKQHAAQRGGKKCQLDQQALRIGGIGRDDGGGVASSLLAFGQLRQQQRIGRPYGAGHGKALAGGQFGELHGSGARAGNGGAKRCSNESTPRCGRVGCARSFILMTACHA
jgi:hypothetical protein